MSGFPDPFDPVRFDRALERLSEHIDLVGRRTAQIEERRAVVRKLLEEKLGPELTVRLLSSLAPASA
jgi:hypothetical protein